MISFSFPWFKRTAVLCAWLLPVCPSGILGVGRVAGCSLFSLSQQVPACLALQCQTSREGFFLWPFCSNSWRQPARREFSLWSCGGGRVWSGDRCAWTAGHTRDTQTSSRQCAYACDGRARLSGRTSYHTRPSCSWRASHLREDQVKKTSESHCSHKNLTHNWAWLTIKQWAHSLSRQE